MNTTAAAATAGVTVDTVRAWCRYGAVEAVKAAGRWVIDTASLAARIAIGARRARKETTVTTPDYTALAAEARELVARLTPSRGCHPADRIGGARDRASGTHRARNSAQDAALSFDRAAEAAADGRQADERANNDRAVNALDAARSKAAKLAR